MTKRLSPSFQREERRGAVASRLLAGRSIREIASELGTSPTTVHRDADCIRTQWRNEYLSDANEQIQQDLKRIDTALSAIWPEVTSGHLAAIDRMLKLLDARARYLGLYAAEKIQGEFSVTYLEQVRKEDAVIAEYAEIIEQAIQHRTTEGDTSSPVEVKALSVGTG